MAGSLLVDVAKFTATAGGTGSFVVSAAVTGYQTPATATAITATQYSYRAESADLTQWEVGQGTYTSSNVTITRTPLFNSVGGSSAINFTLAPQVGFVLLAEDTLPVVSVNPLTNSISSDISLSSTSAYFTGPVVSQGTVGTWFASGSLTLLSTGGAHAFLVRLWDGTTIMDSLRVDSPAANFYTVASVSGFITSPTSNIKISASDISSASGKMIANVTGDGKDCTVTAYRIK